MKSVDLAKHLVALRCQLETGPVEITCYDDRREVESLLREVVGAIDWELIPPAPVFTTGDLVTVTGVPGVIVKYDRYSEQDLSGRPTKQHSYKVCLMIGEASIETTVTEHYLQRRAAW